MPEVTKRAGWLLVAHDCLAESYAHQDVGNLSEAALSFKAYRWALRKAGQ